VIEAAMPTNRPTLRIAIVIFLPVLGIGCAGESLVPVSGTATCNGKPVSNLVINFVPEKGPKSYALTDKAGHFKMICTDGRDGVLVGTHKVWVKLNTIGTKENPGLQDELAAKLADPVMAQMLQKYGDVQTTPLTFTIEDGKEFELKLD
jgi:hypothetical protein